MKVLSDSECIVSQLFKVSYKKIGPLSFHANLLWF